MTAARVTFLARKDTALGRRACVSWPGEPLGCLALSEAGELALFGSPVALCRPAVAARDAAISAKTRCVRGGLMADRPRVVA